MKLKFYGSIKHMNTMDSSLLWIPCIVNAWNPAVSGIEHEGNELFIALGFLKTLTQGFVESVIEFPSTTKRQKILESSFS